MLIGKRIILEEIDHKNIEWMRQQRNDPEMRKYFREWRDISKDQQEKKWFASRGNNSDPNHVYFQIMALPRIDGAGISVMRDEDVNDLVKEVDGTEELSVDKAIEQRELIGCCGLHYIDWRMRFAEFGIFISKEARGLGLGREALIMLCNYGFREMNLHKIWAEVYEFNKAISLYNDIGFSTDGVLRDNCFNDGKYYNSHIISVLEDEWFNKYGGR